MAVKIIKRNHLESYSVQIFHDCFILSTFLQIQATGLLIVSLLLYFLHMDETILWVLFICLGVCNGPLTASGFGMVNHYIEMTSMAQMVPQIGAAVGDLVILFAMGYSYEHYGPYSIWGHSLAIAVTLFTVVTAMQILGYLHGDRFQQQNDSENWLLHKLASQKTMCQYTIPQLSHLFFRKWQTFQIHSACRSSPSQKLEKAMKCHFIVII